MFRDLHSRISFAFLERYPSPADAQVWESAPARVPRPEHYTRRHQPGQLLAKPRRAPEAGIGELKLVGIRRALVLSLVATIKVINEQIKRLRAAG
jgi:hypothetical protein